MSKTLELWNLRQQSLSSLIKDLAGFPSLDRIKEKDEHTIGNIALLISNQVKYLDDHPDIPKFIKQISIPTLINVFASLPNFFSTQAFREDNFAPVGTNFFYLSKANDIKSIKYEMVNPKVDPSFIIRDLGDKEIHPSHLIPQCSELAMEILDDLVNRFLQVLILDAGHQLKCKVNTDGGTIAPKTLLDTIEEASQKIKDSIGCHANFVVMPFGVANFLRSEMKTEFDFESLPFNTRKVGCFRNKWIAYFASYCQNRILVGYKGSHPADSGFFFTPGVQFYLPKKEKDKYMISTKNYSRLVFPNYYASIELIEDNTSDSMVEF